MFYLLFFIYFILYFSKGFYNILNQLTANAKTPLSTMPSENTNLAPTLAKSKKVATLSDTHWKILRPTGHRSVRTPSRNCKISPQMTGLHLICAYLMTWSLKWKRQQMSEDWKFLISQICVTSVFFFFLLEKKRYLDSLLCKIYYAKFTNE